MSSRIRTLSRFPVLAAPRAALIPAALVAAALLVCLSASGGLAAGAADAAGVAGRVIDASSGLPVAGVSLLVAGEETPVASDRDGRFAIADAPGAPFTLVASHLAYETRVLTVDPARTDQLELALQPVYYEGEKMVVSASRTSPRLRLSSSNLTGEDIRRLQQEKDLPHLLEAVPGVYAAGDAGNGVGYTYLKLRGFDQRRIGVTINGTPLNDPEDHQVYWVNLPDFASSLEDVQVQRGVSNALGGISAIGGSVNLVTDVLRPERGGRAYVAAGSYGTDKQSLSYQTGLLGGRLASSLRISHLQSDGYRERAGSEQWGVFWSGRLITERSSTQLNIYTGRELTRQSWFGLTEAELAANRRANPESYSNAVDDFRQPHYELHHRWRFSDSVLLRNTLYWIHGEGYYENFLDADATWWVSDWAAVHNLDRFLGLPADARVDVVRRQLVDKDQVGWAPRLLWQHAGGRLALGGDLFDFHSDQWGEILAVEGFTPAELADLPDSYRYNGDKTVWSAYANEEVALGAGLTLLAEIHFQHADYTMRQREIGNFAGDSLHAYTVEHDFLNPKGGLHWRAPGAPGGGELGVYGTVGLTHREPSALDYFDLWQGPWDLGAEPLFGSRREVTSGGELAYLEWSDPLVEAEEAVDVELGFTWRRPELSLHLNAYRLDFRHEIVPYGGINPANGLAVRGNADRTLHQGLELAATADLSSLLGLPAGLGRQRLQVAASRSWDEYEDFVFYEDVYDPDTFEYLETVARDFSGNPIAHFPEYLSTVYLSSDFGGVATNLRLRAVGRQYLDNTGDPARSIDPFATVDLGVVVHPAALGLGGLERTELFVEVSNLTGAEYETWGYFDAGVGETFKVPAATRHFIVGVRHEF